MTEHVLVWHPKVPGDVPAESDEQLRLIGMPTGLVRPARPTAADEELTAASRAVMKRETANTVAVPTNTVPRLMTSGCVCPSVP